MLLQLCRCSIVLWLGNFFSEYCCMASGLDFQGFNYFAASYLESRLPQMLTFISGFMDQR